MRNNKLMKFTTFVLLITMVALILVAGTYARYTTELSTEDTAVVAKFVVGATINSEDMTTFSLFDTVTEADGATSESDVATGKIAPGTGGKFDIVLTNSSEVTVDYALTFTETNASNVPIEYSTDGATWQTAADFEKTGTFAINDSEETVTVQWRWAYEGTSSTNYQASQTDETDTELGTAETAPGVDVAVKVTFTQAD